jgi:hypothetical protein
MAVIAVGVSSAMAFLERKRVIHRDVAARNVLVRRCGACARTMPGLPSTVSAARALGKTVYVLRQGANRNGTEDRQLQCHRRRRLGDSETTPAWLHSYQRQALWPKQLQRLCFAQ